MVNGFEMHLDEAGRQVAGRKVEVIVNGNVEDKAGFLAAFRRVEIPDAPRGPVKLDTHGNPIQNIYVRRVERKAGELQNSVIHTYPAVSQFWTYKPEDFLKQPLYTRDSPPCRGC